jgi:hypothetical protein
MTINKLIKWRERIIKGKDKYYPKDLIKHLIHWNKTPKEKYNMQGKKTK